MPVLFEAFPDLYSEYRRPSATTRCSRIDTLEPECSQVEFINENVDYPSWVFFSYVIVQALLQQCDLRLSLKHTRSYLPATARC